ncbi:autoinducer binding domain-containing protein [Epibacterium ulvae]|uniref:autoinducer binding domain-containing protein n=1 Tax=Epibacterium ulvae TaxID=1156985 RepID=UPI001BFC5648|nr:autoinducer binding domain-containing protein [Epibacterium ulvae]MBT8154262.1 autoinducer binding domain-containing protein [Epibacterium ulvae]
MDALNVVVAAPHGAPRWSAAQALADGMGIKSIIVAEGNGSLRNLNWLNTNMPAAWMEEYVAQDYVTIDPVIDVFAYRPGVFSLPVAGQKSRTCIFGKWIMVSRQRDLAIYTVAGSGSLARLALMCRWPTSRIPKTIGSIICRKRDLFAALLASIIGPDTAPQEQQYRTTPRGIISRHANVMCCPFWRKATRPRALPKNLG